MADDGQLLAEIRDLLKEQNRLMQDIKSQNEEMAARNIAYMAKAEAAATATMAQSTEALGGARTLKWAVWVFLAVLLLLFSVPMLFQLLSAP
jgi:hypothetical protein